MFSITFDKNKVSERFRKSLLFSGSDILAITVKDFAKTLKIDWRIGAAYFESMLLDYDVHSNYGNWMYVSGVGNDPRDRTFNLKRQAEMYDSDKLFRNHWLK